MIHQIILSANEDPTYIEFWEPVSYAYKKMFPECTVHLAFLTNRDEDDEYVTELRKHGKVTLFRPDPSIAEFGQAKMIRFVLASQQGNDICYIDDIDLFPLRKEFITDKTDKRPKGHLLCVGGEVYGNNGCYPVSQMTAEGYVWKQFINPLDLDFHTLLKIWSAEPTFDRREQITIKLDFSVDDYFSDERLIRRLIHENPINKCEMPRGYDNYLDATIDRHTWIGKEQRWEYDSGKLERGEYSNAHGIRPYKKNAHHYEPLMNYINRNY